MEQHDRKLGAIILAAGRGSRMNAKKQNKVTFFLADKPLILHSIHVLEKMHFDEIVVVVGHAKQSVQDVLKDSRVHFAEQRKRLGTGHALKCGLKALPASVTDVLVIQGDDSHFYNEKLVSRLLKEHISSDASLTFLTIEVDNPLGLGRIVRDQSGKVKAIVEEKDATLAQRTIQEINPACYLFKVDFLKKNLKAVKKSPITGEYYLTSLVDIAIHKDEPLATLQAGNLPWRGVNTKEELREAERLYKNAYAK